MDALDYIVKRSKVTDSSFNSDARVRAEFDGMRTSLLRSGKILLASGCIMVSGMAAYGSTIDNIYSDYKSGSNDRSFSEENVRYLERQAGLANRTAEALGDLRRADGAIRKQEAYFEGSDPEVRRGSNYVTPRGSSPNNNIRYATPAQVTADLKDPNSTLSRLHAQLQLQRGFSNEDLKLGARFSGGVALLVDKQTKKPTLYAVDSNNVLLVVPADPEVEMSEQVAAVLFIRQLPPEQRADKFRLIVADRAAKVARNAVLANNGPSGP